MNWDAAANEVLAQLTHMVPETFRELAAATARDEAEAIADERAVSAVGGEDVVRAWIRTTPPDQRDALVDIIEAVGYDPLSFAGELESAEGWEEPTDPDSEM